MSEVLDARRLELRELNLKRWDGEEGLFAVKTPLDASLKKNTAFIKKVKTGITKDSESSLVDSIRTTSLQRYINEIAAALSESLSRVNKANDITAAIEVTSALHLRFGELFTPFVGLYCVHTAVIDEQLNERDLKDKLDRIKNILKITMDFYVCGLFRTQNDFPRDELPLYLKKLEKNNKSNVSIIVPMLKEIMGYEFTKGLTLNIVSSFLKRYENYITDTSSELIDQETKVYLKKLLDSYVKTAVKNTEKLSQTIQKDELRSHTISMKTGKVLDDLVESIDGMKVTLNKFNSFCETACPMLNLELPNLKNQKLDKPSSSTTIIISNKLQDNAKQEQKWELIWETEEVKKFYEDIPLLEDLVEEKYITGNADAGEQINQDRGKYIEQLLTSLESASTSDEINQLVAFYWTKGLNNNASKNKIYQYFKTIEDVGKFRKIARFLKINEKHFSKCIIDINERLDKSFRFQIHHDDFAAKEILIFSELVKFKMIPIYVLFHKLRTLILNIDVNGNIDLLTLLFEGCGKVLQYDPDYSENTNEMIDLLKKVKDERHFIHSDYQAVRVFLFSLKPPSVKKFYKKPILSIEERFINQLVRQYLNINNFKEVSDYLERMDWNNKEVAKCIYQSLSRPDTINYINISALAKCVEALSIKIHPGIYVRVIDQLIEDISIGLEVNDYRDNRKRLSQVKYLIELSNLGLIKSEQIIKIIYKIVTFGHESGVPSPNNANELDKPNDYFRIKLVTAIVKSINFKKFESKDDFVTFLRLFDYYLLTKVLPIPIEIDDEIIYLVKRVNEELDMDLERSKDIDDALINLRRSMAEKGLRSEVKEKTKQDTEEEEEEEDDDDDDDDDEDDGDEDDVEGDLDGNYSVYDDDDNSGTDEDGYNDDDDDGLGLSSKNKSDDENDGEEEEEEEDDDDDDESEEDDLDDEYDEEYDESNDFDKQVEEQFQREIEMELNSIISEEMKRPKKNLNLNFNSKLSDRMTGVSATSGLDTHVSDTSVSFVLLQKPQGTKQREAKMLELPKDTSFAKNFIKKSETLADEKERIKSIVLKTMEGSSSV